MLNININNNIFKVQILICNKDKEQGMMFRDFDVFDGVLFIMNDGHHCFWMKNCIIPLDIILVKNKRITKIHHNCKPCESENCPNYCGFGDSVLELKGGTCKSLGLKEIGRAHV